MERTLKLTISLLASNRKDTIPKCLESLRPLLEQVNSELIITDTGCDDELLEYMSKYTDKIVEFKWCNDFAAARNIGLNMARGEWFMYIDDDEWFEDVTELINFFNSEEEKEYVSANYVVRNYNTLKGDVYNEGVVGRIYRMFDGIHFEGKIHESITRPDGNVKQFGAYVHHYGYVFDTEEKRQAHFERNVSMLIGQIEEEPAVARHYAHIYQEYRTMNQPNKILKYAFEALESVDESDRENKVNLCSTYVAVVWAYTAMKDYEQAVKYGEMFLTTKPMTGLAKATLMSFMAEGCLRSASYEKCVEYADEYIVFRDKYKEDGERYYKELAPMLNDTFSDKRIGITISTGLEAAIELGDVKKAVVYILAYDWSKNVYIMELDCVGRLAELMAQADFTSDKELFKDSVRVFGKLFTHIESSNMLVKRIGQMKEDNPEGYACLCNVMINVAGQPGYKELVSIIVANKSGDIGKLYEIYEQTVYADDNVLSMEKEFYEVALDKNIPLGKMICGISVERWTKMLKLWARTVRNRDIIQTKKYLDKFLPVDSIHMKLFEKQIIDILENRKK